MENTEVHYTDNNPYLDEARECTQCRTLPVERIGPIESLYIGGLPVGQRRYGMYLVCKCFKRTKVYVETWKPYLEWNTELFNIESNNANVAQ